MRISTNGIIVNQYNHILLIQRNDTRTWAPPGGMLDAGELPTEGVAREVREETGLIVMPVRLVGLHFTPLKPEPFLGFSFRCIQRGGEIKTSKESPRVGFVAVQDLPRAMASFHRQRIQQALTHAGGPPQWYTHRLSLWDQLLRFMLLNVVYPWLNFRRRWRGVKPYEPPPLWQTSAFTVIRNTNGQVLWVKQGDQELWHLPGGACAGMEPPWQTAVRKTREETGLHVRLTDLSGVYVHKEANQMAFTFTAEIENGSLTTGPTYFAPGEEPSNTVQQHLQRVADVANSIEETTFRYQEGPPLE